MLAWAQYLVRGTDRSPSYRVMWAKVGLHSEGASLKTLPCYDLDGVKLSLNIVLRNLICWAPCCLQAWFTYSWPLHFTKL